MDELDETVLNIQQRQKRGLIMRRYRAKIERSKELSQKRLAPEKNIKKRAYAQARQIVRKRVAGKRGAEYEKLGPSEKMAIDRAIDKKAKAIKKLALRLIPKVKQAEQKRLHSFMKGQSIHNFGKPEGHHTEPTGDKASPGSAVSEELNLLFAEAFTSNETEVDQTGDAQDPQFKNKKKKKDDCSCDDTKSTAKGSQIKMYNKFGEEREQDTLNYLALTKKSEKSGVDIETLGEVYDRGLEAWKEGYNVSPTQYAFARVNSFINKGKTYFTDDADLQEGRLSFSDKIAEASYRDSGYRNMMKASQKADRIADADRAKREKQEQKKSVKEEIDLEEANKYSVHKGKEGWYVNQHTDNGVWNHSVQTGYHDSKNKAVAWAKKHAGNREHTIEIKESTELDESFRKWQIQQNLGKSKKEFLSPPNTVGGMSTKRIHHNEKHDIEVYHGMQVYKTTPHYVFHNDKLVHMTTSRDNAMKHAEKLGNKLDKEEKKSVKEEVELDEATVHSVHVRVYDKHGEKQLNSKEFEKHVKDHGGEFHYISDKGVAFKFKHAHQASDFHRKNMSHFRELGSDNDGPVNEEVQVDESNNTPYVKPHIEKGSTKQSGWKASNKHGRVKYFGMDFKKSAEKHAGIDEETMKGKDPCWKGYQMVGKKIKNGKQVPNCVPEETQIDEVDISKFKMRIAKPKTDSTPKKTFMSVIDELDIPAKHLNNARSVWNRTKDVEAVRKFISNVKEETEAVGTKVRKNTEIVDRKPKTPGVYTKQSEVKTKIIDEEGNATIDPKDRLVGTDSLVKTYKKDTPGQGGDLNESFNIAFAAGVGVSLTAADLGMKAQGGFALHPSVIEEMEARDLEEDAVSAEKKPVYQGPRRKADGSYTPAKTVMRKSGRKIIDVEEPEDADKDEHDGK